MVVKWFQKYLCLFLKIAANVSNVNHIQCRIHNAKIRWWVLQSATKATTPNSMWWQLNGTYCLNGWLQLCRWSTLHPIQPPPSSSFIVVVPWTAKIIRWWLIWASSSKSHETYSKACHAQWETIPFRLLRVPLWGCFMCPSTECSYWWFAALL